MTLMLPGHTSANVNNQDGDCFVYVKEKGVHKGWNREKCESMAYFICQLGNDPNVVF